MNKLNTNFTIIFICLVILLIVIIKINYKFINLYDYQEFVLKDFNAQGIECIKDRLVLTENSASVYELNNNKINLLGVLNRPNEEFYNNINFLAHLTSIAKFDNNDYFAVGKLASRPPSLVKFDYNNFLNKGSISNDDIYKINVMEEYESLHIEELIFNKTNFLIMGGTRNNTSFLDFFEYENNILNCSIINKNKIQNIFWDVAINTITLSSNIFHYYGGILYNYDVRKKINTNCPELKLKSTKIILTLKELQGYTSCNSREYYVLWSNNNSYIYSKELI